MSRNLASIILAAGKGTRMKSDLPKVLHEIDGKQLVKYVIDQANDSGSVKNILVVGYKGDMVIESTKNLNVEYVWQHEQLGTGHAVMMADKSLLGFDGDVLILCGDVPALKPETIKELHKNHIENSLSISVLTTKMEDTFGYGRIIKDENGLVLKIVEEKDANSEEKLVNEINSGVYLVDRELLFKALKSVKSENAQKEYYLTDIVEILKKEGFKVGSYCTPDSDEIMGINTIEQLNKAKNILDGRKK
ncbi:MAG: UDP-N-acetylglucosamine pyrophosphorylase [Candidatus Cloacimonadota bacterium]|nr:MAG: UDP-N-acetylglucosamine pyrophosphorylase [Candidatus Cloacimonadota bacterium]PIE79478.1 MAG: UDP-N-acetylglucosamine pyrophosphorylase [Candidatus Delongbacteria bacterium]